MNYSPQAERLLAAGEVEIDLFKCPPWPGLIAAAKRWRPVMVHFDFQAGQGSPTAADLAAAADWIERTSTYWVNTHLAPPTVDGESVGTATERTLRQAVSDIEVLGKRFGPATVVVENVPWERRSDYPIDRVAADPLLLSTVVETTGCGLLLDLAHSRLAAEELGVAAEDHLYAHPNRHLAELHVTGLGNDAEGRRRDHMPMDPRAWQLLELALGAIAAGRWRRPWAVALEYGGVGPLFEWRSEPRVLRRDLRRLAELLELYGLRRLGHSRVAATNTVPLQ